MPTPRLLDLYRAEMSEQTATNERKAVRRHWLRAVVEEMNERSLTCETVPFRRSKLERVERFRPFWRSRSDDDLAELLSHLAPFFRREENRKLPL